MEPGFDTLTHVRRKSGQCCLDDTIKSKEDGYCSCVRYNSNTALVTLDIWIDLLKVHDDALTARGRFAMYGIWHPEL